MITAKFGGTAITPRNLIYVKNIITSAHKRIVVSAIGRESPYDVKTTDLLERYFTDGDCKWWEALADKYERLAVYNAINVDVESLLYDAKRRARMFGKAYCMSLGEELSAKLVAAYLGFTYIEAEEIVRFNKRGLSYHRTVKLMQDAFRGVDCLVTGGYYGGSSNGRQTFSRGGSDVTGALVAVASGSVLYENWTDAQGVCVANPASVNGVYTLSNLSYGQMNKLSCAGAEVLHPDAVRPVERAGIPIRIGNFFSPDGASTLVDYCRADNEILSIAERKERDNFITTVLHSMPLGQISGVIAGFLSQNIQETEIMNCMIKTDPLTVLSVEYTADTAKLVTKTSVIKDLYKYFNCVNRRG